MTVQVRHFNPSLPLSNSQEMLNPTSYMACDSVFPSSDGNTCMLRPEKTMNAHILSCNNCAVDIPVSRKRQREDYITTSSITGKITGRCRMVGGDLAVQMMRQQIELDQLIYSQTETMKREIEEQRIMQTNTTMRLIREEITKKLREKDEQIEKMSKLSVVLEERAKSLDLENQLWQDLAQSNEATAKALQSDLEQLIVQVNYKTVGRIDENADAESCCGSNSHDDEVNDGAENLGRWKEGGSGKRMCRRCGRKESCVMVLPCRHLCLCAACGPMVDVCPVCKSINNACVDVYFS